MKFDILLSGVGGQGVLSMAAIIGQAAIEAGLHAKQSEVHGMAQRGGAVQAYLRISDRPIASDLIPLGGADLILSLEPVEGLRHLAWLAPDGALISAAEPYLNITDYPEIEGILARIRSLPHGLVVEAARLAEQSGDLQTVNTVMVGAAAARLPFRREALERAVTHSFARKGEAALRANLSAFEAGWTAAA
jgi:indolepyruvate ferredoxin oxidoreductase, beta subunit